MLLVCLVVNLCYYSIFLTFSFDFHMRKGLDVVSVFHQP